MLDHQLGVKRQKRTQANPVTVKGWWSLVEGRIKRSTSSPLSASPVGPFKNTLIRESFSEAIGMFGLLTMLTGLSPVCRLWSFVVETVPNKSFYTRRAITK